MLETLHESILHVIFSFCASRSLSAVGCTCPRLLACVKNFDRIQDSDAFNIIHLYERPDGHFVSRPRAPKFLSLTYLTYENAARIQALIPSVVHVRSELSEAWAMDHMERRVRVTSDCAICDAMYSSLAVRHGGDVVFKMNPYTVFDHDVLAERRITFFYGHLTERDIQASLGIFATCRRGFGVVFRTRDAHLAAVEMTYVPRDARIYATISGASLETLERLATVFTHSMLLDNRKDASVYGEGGVILERATTATGRESLVRRRAGALRHLFFLRGSFSRPRGVVHRFKAIPTVKVFKRICALHTFSKNEIASLTHSGHRYIFDDAHKVLSAFRLLWSISGNSNVYLLRCLERLQNEIPDGEKEAELLRWAMSVAKSRVRVSADLPKRLRRKGHPGLERVMHSYIKK